MRYNYIDMKYLVVGLESSCTKAVSRMIAYNLKMINSPDEWDGHEKIENDINVVCHRSMPHHYRDYFIDSSFASMFDFTIIVTRDWNCSLESKIISHTPDRLTAIDEHVKGLSYIRDIVSSVNNVHVFSSESAFLLQDLYTVPFLKNIGIEDPIHIDFINVNEKHVVKDNG